MSLLKNQASKRISCQFSPDFQKERNEGLLPGSFIFFQNLINRTIHFTDRSDHVKKKPHHTVIAFQHGYAILTISYKFGARSLSLRWSRMNADQKNL